MLRFVANHPIDVHYWFDEPDDLDRVGRALSSIDDLENPLVANV